MKLSERIHTLGYDAGDWGFDDIADEVAQLEAKLEAMLCGECEKSMLHCTCEENEGDECLLCRLEAALREIAYHPHCTPDMHTPGVVLGEYGMGVVDGHRCAAKVARDALGGE